MDSTKAAPPSTGNALAQPTVRNVSTTARPGSNVIGNPAGPQPAANPQARHAEDRVRSHASGADPKPTKAFAGRSSTPSSANTSGMERAMAAHADRVHRVPKRR